MFSQRVEQIIKKSLADLDSFKPVHTRNSDRNNLIMSYWQFHQRFKSFKICPSRNSHILDIGSGSGGLFFWKEYLLPVRNDLKMTAVDLKKGDYFDRYEQYSLLNLDYESLPYDTETFSFIIASHLIEHVKDWKFFLENCERVLQHNGIIYIETPSRHTVDLPKKDFYIQKGFLCTTINFFDDHTHVSTIDLDEINSFANSINLIALEKGFCRNPYLENILLSFGFLNKDIEVCQYGLWSKLLFSSYIILQKL